jgi:PAS domain S-box-containing protein
MIASPSITDASPVRILVVDDLPEKLLVYRTVLEEPSQEVICATSGADALKQVLRQDFAVILLDVNMPDMNGFETASLIRARRRCAHTPIIFITAYADELHAVKGYAHGAVDYILSPVVPEILRTKVRVFVELFRKTRQIARQAEELRELQAREHRRQLSETTTRLELALDAGRMGAWEWDLTSRLVSWSPTLESIFGFAPGQFTGTPDELRSCLHEDDRERVLNTLAEAQRAGGDFALEHRIARHDGHEAWVEVRGKVLAAAGEGLPRLVGVCMDITERKRAECELAEHRARLEELVSERTEALEASLERLRVADRLASIGTLAAGLGHDMGNLLLPVRLRLEVLEKMDLPASARDDIKAIKNASDYLQRLSQGLRLFALDPDDGDGPDEATDLQAWWLDVEPFLRNALPKGVALESALAPELPPLAMPSHRFTQAVYNLVQNAGDAMRGRHGRVRFAAKITHNGSCVSILVSDDGPGMTEEVRRRCMEPFFTTKTRGISTGLGLALVQGAVLKAGGSIELDSQLSVGTVFTLILPVANRTKDDHATAERKPAVARVSLCDARMAAYTSTVLRSLGFSVDFGPWSPVGDADLLVIDAGAVSPGDLEAFVAVDERRRVIVFGVLTEAGPSEQIISVPSRPSSAQLRVVLERAAEDTRLQMQEIAT